MVPHLEAWSYTEGVVPFSNIRDPFMHLCRHSRVARYLGVLMARILVHNSDLWGDAIIVCFQGLHSSSRVRDFVILVEISIT